MSQITCGVVRDLLPLYVDGCCGADSRRLVEEHLAGCPDCRRARADMAGELPPAEGAPAPEAEPARAMKTGLKKLRRRWALSLLAVLLIPLLGWLTWNQVHGTGPCFTNFHERMLADGFVRTLAAGDYEGAFHRLELDELYQDFSGDSRLDRADLSDFESRAQAFFLDSARALKEAVSVHPADWQRLYGAVRRHNGGAGLLPFRRCLGQRGVALLRRQRLHPGAGSAQGPEPLERVPVAGLCGLLSGSRDGAVCMGRGIAAGPGTSAPGP